MELLLDPLFYVCLALIGLLFYVEWLRWREREALRQERDILTQKLMAKSLADFQLQRSVEKGVKHPSRSTTDEQEAEIERIRTTG